MANLPVLPVAVLNIPSAQAPDYNFEIDIEGGSLPTSAYYIVLRPKQLPRVSINTVDAQGRFVETIQVIVSPPEVVVTASHGPQGAVKRVLSDTSSLEIAHSGGLVLAGLNMGLSFVPLNISSSSGTNSDLTVVGTAIHYTNIEGYDGLSIDLSPGQFRYANNSGNPAFYLIFPTIKVSYRNSLIKVFIFNGGNELAVPIYAV